MTFTVLSDADIGQLLSGLSRADALTLLGVLGGALTSYSLHDEQQYQPHRAAVSRGGEGAEAQVSLFMPATTPDLIGTKIVGVAPSAPKKDQKQSTDDGESKSKSKPPPPGLKSVLTLCDATGQAVGVLNAAELTAFRTSLGSMLLYRYRERTDSVVVFGAGKQAAWHIRLALLLRGPDIKRITVVNRSRARTRALVDGILADAGGGGGGLARWGSSAELDVFDDARGDRDAAIEALVREADAIFCTTPATSPLFPASYLTSEQGRAKSRYISMIGSYRLDMQEIDPEFFKVLVDPKGVLAGQGHDGGFVVVDSRSGCLQEAGELVKADISPEKMVEVGKLLHDKESKGDAGLSSWLQKGLVVYKSVGTGVMDLSIGKALMDLAREKNVGTLLENF
ncbi:uncharacterized protein E0L32_012401 [Thyridium curvatum]|uniref:Ornithine cyclodeaminase n=1 Tax=Thyridium curvatum TaxID=1093900 RepID=A0A507BBI8_9PEZI|nr:uncharacterized protein E0L32_012401 [Thyridium curvatum]TPX16606.1 hypothetical protein E0L32_012401 [Thyridium curvatum]